MTSRTRIESTIQRRIEPICKSQSIGQRQIEPIRKSESTSQRRIEPDSGLAQTRLSSQIRETTIQRSQTLGPIFMPAGSRRDHSVPNRPWESQRR
jgi:hypothetical protein